jgi:hypothetical protein
MARGLTHTPWATTVEVRRKGLHGQRDTRGYTLNEHTHLLGMRSAEYGYFKSMSEAVVHRYLLVLSISRSSKNEG